MSDETDTGFHAAVRQLEQEKRTTSSAPKPKADEPPKTNGSTQALRSIVDRIVRLEEEKRGLQADIKEIFQEAKSGGFNPKAVRVIVKREMEDSDQRAAREAVEADVDTMLAALGGFASSPLGEAAVKRAGG